LIDRTDRSHRTQDDDDEIAKLRLRVSELEAELARERTQLETVFAHIPAIFYVKDRDSRYMYGSPYGFKVFGVSHDTAIGKTDPEIFPAALAARFMKSDQRVLEGQRVENESYAVPTPDGPRDFAGVRFPIPGPDGVAIAVCGFAVDVTERVAMARELERLARTDPLTGIGNRRRFDENLAIEIGRAARSSEPLSLLLCDVDHFKPYNDGYGHQQGDACLAQIAHALDGAIRRPADLAARYGGEEFALVLPGTSAEGAAAMAQRVREAVRALAIPHERSEGRGIVTISVGAATVTGGWTAAELIELADRALYAAKAAGRDCEVSVNDEHPPASVRRS
jgi:diguanylate cyclase (GGDEF)-like protein/PAS domain S-box-containing protein